jgi:integrase
MPRPNLDGTPAAAANRRHLTDLYVRKTRPDPTRVLNAWDSRINGLVLTIQSSGFRSFRYFYRCNGRSRWYHIGDASKICLADARSIAIDLSAKVAKGDDPVADRQAQREADTFGKLAADFVTRYSSRHNKSYKQAEALVNRFAVPKWGKLKADAIIRKDVRALFDGLADTPVLANQAKAACSKIFSWAVEQDVLKVNPCVGVKPNPVNARERVLSDLELKKFWMAFDNVGLIRSSALKLALLTGARGSELATMRIEHIDKIDDDAWIWRLPGKPSNGWVGTKNKKDHRLFLSKPARDILTELANEEPSGFVFGRLTIDALDQAMRKLCTDLGIEDRVRPHDLRRTFGSTVTRLKFGRPAMDRLLNHADRTIAKIYDRHQYHDEDRAIMEAVGRHVMAVVKGKTDKQNVVPLIARK